MPCVAPDPGCALIVKERTVRSRQFSAGLELKHLRAAPSSFAVRVDDEPRDRTVHLAGALDVSAQSLVGAACCDGEHMAVVVDLADLAFMDCAGYGALMAARQSLSQWGGSLTLESAAGQPARFLELLSTLEESGFDEVQLTG
jgi:anti-anti-sigma factor